MSKYDYFNPRGSHGMIVRKVNRGDTVLECGCATGYMTEFLNVKLGCKVHIIEIDPNACKRAAVHAEDSFCGDLSCDAWREYYNRNRYDKILFADVLEHLNNPDETLKKAVSLLKDDGKVIISIPNICHNDIIIKMFYDHWQYTDLGLLDSTHIHFWGKHEIKQTIVDAGLQVDEWDAVMAGTQFTEQRMPMVVDRELMEILKKREDGEVYQWVLTCSKQYQWSLSQ